MKWQSLILLILLIRLESLASANDVVVFKGDVIPFDGVLVPDINYRDFVTDKAELNFLQSLKEHEDNYEGPEDYGDSVYTYLSIFAAGFILGSVYQK